MRALGYSYWVVPAVILIAWFAWVAGVLLHGNGWNWVESIGISHFNFKNAAEFGDAFGPLSSLMAALAAAGAWHAVALSRIQAFESTFYSLLAHHNQIVAATDIQSKKRVAKPGEKTRLEDGDLYVGRDSYRRLVRNLRLSISANKSSDPVGRAIEGYKSFHKKYQDDIAHYFRTLYHIIKFIDDSNVKNKQFYAQIVRAQLSNSEQILLMYNCSVGKGREKFKFLIEKYALLHNINMNDDPSHWENTIICPSIKSEAFRIENIEKWPTVKELKAEIGITVGSTGITVTGA